MPKRDYIELEGGGRFWPLRPDQRASPDPRPFKWMSFSPFFTRDGRVLPPEMKDGEVHVERGHRYAVTIRGEWPLVSYELELTEDAEST